MEKPFFFLHHYCYLEKGEQGSAIYDLINQKLFTIDNEIGGILNQLSTTTMSLKEILQKYDINKKNIIIDYFSEIKKLGLGDFYKKRVFIEKLRPDFTKEKILEKKQTIPLHRIWIEISNECNLNCIHCISGVQQRFSCSLLSQKIPTNQLIETNTLLKIISEVALLNCQEIIIAGGEPLLATERLIPVIKHARKLKIPKIILYSNGLLFNDEILLLIKNNNLTWKSVLYSCQAEIHDYITQTPGSWKKQIEQYKNALQLNLDLEVMIETLKQNQDSLRETVKFLNQMGIKNVTYNFVTSDSFWPRNFSNHIFMNKKNFREIKREIYFKNRESHSCWNGQLAVTIDGNILPCQMARRDIIANIRQKGIRDIIRKNEVKPWWELTKDHIESCDSCEFRYACFDCPVRIDEKTGRRFCGIYN